MRSTRVYEVRPRKDKRGVDLISDALPFGGLWYAGPNAVANAIGYAQHRSRSHHAVIRVYDDADNVIETHGQREISKNGELRPPTSVEVSWGKHQKMPVLHRECKNRNAALALRWYSKTIKIPARLQGRPLEALLGSRRVSARLVHVLQRSGLHALGDLHGRKVADFAWKKNCGLKTLQELDSLASAFAKPPSFRKRWTTVGRKAGETTLPVPKSVCGLRFDELPITKRLANVARSHGLRTLGNLRGRTFFELLHYKACGWRTLVEIQQLIERAVSGEFDVARIEESKAPAELSTLLEQGMAKLSRQENQFLLARIEGRTFAEIGRRFGFTRAWAHRVIAKSLDNLMKTWGPRVPRLLETADR